jgi:pantoate--beta-alanine ligase
VAKLFNIVQPDVAVFGQKDAQQARVIERVVRDLNFPVRVVVEPTAREADGLAVSSRNRYLSVDERARATALQRALKLAEALYRDGERDARAIEAQMRGVLDPEVGAGLEYLAIVDGETLEPVAAIRGPTLVAIAARIGSTRLIDNAVLGSGERRASSRR